MERIVENSLESKKEWTRPELRELDIDRITAHQAASGNDGAGGHTAS